MRMAWPLAVDEGPALDAAIAALSSVNDNAVDVNGSGDVDGKTEWVLVPRVPTREMVSAMASSSAVDDEGQFPLLMDLLDFSGENKTHTVIRAAYAAMLASAPQPPSGGEVIGYVRRAPLNTRDIWRECSKAEHDFISLNGYWTDPKDGFNWPSIARTIYDAAPPSAPVGLDDAMIRRFVDAVDPMRFNVPPPNALRRGLEAALAQQPAAVDGAKRSRYMNKQWIAEWCDDHDIELAGDAYQDLLDALAAQPGGES